MLEIFKFIIFPNNKKTEKIFSNTEKKKFILWIIFNYFLITLVSIFIFLINFDEIENLLQFFFINIFLWSFLILFFIIIINIILFWITKIFHWKWSFSDIFLIFWISSFIFSFSVSIMYSHYLWYINLYKIKFLAFIWLLIIFYSLWIFIYLINKVSIKNWLKTIWFIFIIILVYFWISENTIE